MISDAAILESIVFLDHFSDLKDLRQLTKVVYPLNEILLVALLGTLAGAETFTAIARFGAEKLELLRRILPFANGVPEHDRLGEVFAALDPEQFQQCFVRWVAPFIGLDADVVAVDGKTSRRSGTKNGRKPIHMVSAFAARQRLVMGQVKTAEKSNEITAIPALLSMLDIENSVVTIDAMGCQRKIATMIIEKKADYVFGLKKNQGNLRDDVECFATEQKACNFANCATSYDEQVDGEHGRVVTRKTTVFHDVRWLQERHKWPGLKSIVMVESERWIANTREIGTETRFYITSLNDTADKLSDIVRSHWGVESMHWLMDCVMRDDECRVRTNHAPANFATIKHLALNLLRRSPIKLSMTSKRQKAGWNDEYLLSLLA